MLNFWVDPLSWLVDMVKQKILSKDNNPFGNVNELSLFLLGLGNRAHNLLKQIKLCLLRIKRNDM